MKLQMTVLSLATWLILAASSVAASVAPSPDVHIAAFTAYIEPDAEALPVSEREPITGWTDPKQKSVWYGKLNATGRLEIAVSMRLPDTSASHLRLRVARQALTAQVRGRPSGPIVVAF